MQMKNNPIDRKVISVGGSIGITIPADLVKQMGLSSGVNVEIQPTKNGFTVTKKPSLDPEFIENMEKGFEKYHQALETLRKSDE